MTGRAEVAERARRLWWAAGLWLGAIYSTLYPARFAIDWLRGHNLLRVSVWSAFALAAVAVALWARRRSLGRIQLTVVATAVVVVFVSVLRMPRFEERLHFIQYGVLGALVYGAARDSGLRVAALWAAAIAALAGLGDELIQGALPNRYFGWNDVRVNALAGILVAGALALVDRLERRSTVPSSDGQGDGQGPGDSRST